MTFGFSKPRPTAQDYDGFIKVFSSGLEELEIDGLSLMIYGSYVRNDYVAGRSDIDGALIFPDEYVIDKENLARCSDVLKRALSKHEIPFQVSVNEIATMRDGRFNTYTAEFKDYFAREGKVFLGPDYRGKMGFEEEKSGDLHAMSFNLRKARTGLLFLEHELSKDYERVVGRFSKSLDAASRASKQVFQIMDGKVKGYRFSGLQRVKEELRVDTSTLERIQGLYEDPGQLDLIYRNRQEMISLWNDAVTSFERIVGAFIELNKK